MAKPDQNITYRTGDRHVMWDAGLIPTTEEELQEDIEDGAKRSELPKSSSNIKIILRGVPYEKLVDPAFQESKAKMIFTWMKENLPHGIYQKLLDKMLKCDQQLYEGFKSESSQAASSAYPEE